VEAGNPGCSKPFTPSPHTSPSPPQLLQQARAVVSPNSISEAAAAALAAVAPHVNQRAQAALSHEPELSCMGHAGLLAAAVMSICRCLIRLESNNGLFCNSFLQHPSRCIRSPVPFRRCEAAGFQVQYQSERRCRSV
jgi:hypothetical protein